MEQQLSRCCDLTQTAERGRHMTRPPAARPNIYHLSHTERWHLFILPGPRLRNQFHSNTRPLCNANVQYAALSGTVQLHGSATVMPYWWVWMGCCVWGRSDVFFPWCVDGVGEWLRRGRHVDPAFWKWSEAVSSLLAWRRIWRLPHLRGMSVRDKAQVTQLGCYEVQRLRFSQITKNMFFPFSGE